MTLAVDTSVAVPMLHASHDLHRRVSEWAAGRDLALSGHAVAETYAVLTRLPGGLAPSDAHRLITERFAPPFQPSTATVDGVTATLSRLGISGGAVYDALVALAARDNNVTLASRDSRARATYDAVGVEVLVVPG